ncbi:SDR family oxidoreductase [Streptomyces sp. NPDC018833]|uniref:SDR family oxidoreductase n=1 Tax=Streptomyces sp. NPDC018833 TaxID=3365053 RepID=UPI003796AD1F
MGGRAAPPSPAPSPPTRLRAVSASTRSTPAPCAPAPGTAARPNSRRCPSSTARPGREPEDIAAAVAFLASRDAAWITGTTPRVDGGLLAVDSGFQQLRARYAANDEPPRPPART